MTTPCSAMTRSAHPEIPAADSLLRELAAYVTPAQTYDETLLMEAAWCLMDALGSAMLALQDHECTRWLGSLIPGQTASFGARVPGTDHELDPATAAANLAFCFRWGGLECQWLGQTRVCPSDPAAPILAVSDWLARNLWHTGQFRAFGRGFGSRTMPPTMREVFSALLCAQDIQAGLAESENWSKRGCSTGLLSRVASCAALSHLLGADQEQLIAALSLAWQAGVSPAGPRRQEAWSAAAEAQQSVVFSLRALAGDPGCPGILSLPGTGFQDACHGGDPVRLSRPLGAGACAQITYNLALPDSLDHQAAVEAASRLHPRVSGRLSELEAVELYVHEAALGGSGLGHPSAQAALIQAVASTLVLGRPVAEGAGQMQESAIRALALCTEAREDSLFTADCRDPERRTLPGAVLVRFRDGTRTERVLVEYPIGHYKRRKESLPLLFAKTESALASRLDDQRVEELLDLMDRPAQILGMPVQQFVDLWTV